MKKGTILAMMVIKLITKKQKKTKKTEQIKKKNEIKSKEKKLQ